MTFQRTWKAAQLAATQMLKRHRAEAERGNKLQADRAMNLAQAYIVEAVRLQQQERGK